VVQALVATRQGAANTFSLCLGERIGLLLLAGHSGGSRSLLARPDGATIGSMVAKATERFTLHVRDVKVGTATGPALNSAIISERRQNRRWPRSHAWQSASPLRFHSLRLPVSAYKETGDCRGQLKLLWSLLADDVSLTCVGLTYGGQRIEWPRAHSRPEPMATWSLFTVDTQADVALTVQASQTVFHNA
jgi:hypothetical protein